MQCPECGGKVSRHAALCPTCGAVFSPARAAQSAPSAPVGEEPPKRRIWPIAFVIVVVLALASLVIIPLLQESAAAARADHRVTFVMKTPGYNGEATAIPVHVAGTLENGGEYEETVYLDGGGNGVVLTPGTYTLSFPGGSILANGTVLVAPADQQLEVTVPAGLARNAFVQVPADQVVAYTAVAPADLTADALDAVYQAAAADPADRGKAATLRGVAQEAHDAALEKKEADTAALEKKATAALDVSEGDEVSFIGTLEIDTPEQVGERVGDENIQWNLYGHTLAVLWLDSPRKVTLERTVEGYYGYYDDNGYWHDSNSQSVEQEYEVSCLVLNNDVEGLYTYNGGDDGTLSAHDGKRVLATGKISAMGDWSTSQVSPLTLQDPTLEDL